MRTYGPDTVRGIAMDDESFASPFELWCEARGIHPEHPGAWELYLQDSRGEGGERPPRR